MASKEEIPTVSGLKQKVLEDYLTCIICSDTYEDPQQLKCQHTFCLKCLMSYVQNSQFQNSFPCPVCRTNIAIHGMKIDSLKHILINDMLTLFKNLKEFADVEGEISFPTSVSKFCNLCDEERTSDSYCPVCFIWLCEPCTRGHKKLQATKAHSLMHVNDFYKFIDSLVKEKCIKIVAIKEDIEFRLTSLQTATCKTSEARSEVELEILIRHQALQNTIDNQKNGLLQQLDSKCSSISKAIDQYTVDLRKMHQKVCGLMELYENLQKEPTNLQSTGVDDLEKAAELIEGDYRSIDSRLNSSDIPSIEYKSVVGSDDFQEYGSAYGTILLRSFPSVSLLYTGDGVTRQMNQCTHGNQITGLSVFDDKHYLVVSGNKCSHFMDSVQINLGLKSQTSSTCAWGVTQINKNKCILTSMEGCLGSGKITVVQRNAANMFQISDVMVDGLTSPRGVCGGQGGSFMVCDQFDRCVYCFSQDGKLKRIIKKSKDGSPLFIQPMFVTQNKNGDIVVSDHGSFIKILSPDGDIKYTYVSGKPKSEFWGVTTDKDGNILVADWSYGIHILKENGDFMMLRNDFPFGMHPMSIDSHPQHNTFMIGTSAGEIYFMS